MLIHGFAVVESNLFTEKKIEDYCRRNSSSYINFESVGDKSISEYIFTEFFSFTLEYSYVDSVSGNVRYFYTIKADDWFIYWSFFMNLFYSAGLSCVGGLQNDGGTSIWFDVQGKTGAKGWLSKVKSLDDVKRWDNVLKLEDRSLLGLQGFKINNVIFKQ